MLDREIAEFRSLDRPGVDEDDVVIHVHRLMRAVRAAEQDGQPRDVIRAALSDVRGIHARSPFIRRLQEWPRGYPGDFETIEALCEARPGTRAGTLEHALERYAYNCAAAQQHRNKVAHQGRLILDAFRAHRSEARVLTLACGGSRDIAPFAAELADYGGTLVMNDVDPGALALSRSRLSALGERLVIVPGNGIVRYPDVAKHGPFDLVVAGGLFDYLPDRVASHLLRGVWASLRPAGRFFWTNMARGNPYRPWIETCADWILLERSDEDVLALAAAAGIPAASVKLSREETGLTVLVEVVRG